MEVGKQAAFDQNINDDKTPSKDMCNIFSTQSDMDCTAHMARRIRKPNEIEPALWAYSSQGDGYLQVQSSRVILQPTMQLESRRT